MPVVKCASIVVKCFLRMVLLVVCIILTYTLCYPSSSNQSVQYVVKDMIDVSQLNNSILVKLAYSTTDNFLNSDVYGDLENCYLRREVAEMLNRAQIVLDQKREGYRLILYDCLRPRSVQYGMWRLVKGTEQEGYVADPATGSVHNFGAAVDLHNFGFTNSPIADSHHGIRVLVPSFTKDKQVKISNIFKKMNPIRVWGAYK